MKNNDDIIIQYGGEATLSSEMSKNKIEDYLTETENLTSELNSSEYASDIKHTLSDAYGISSVDLATNEDLSYPLMKSETSTWDPNFPTSVDPLSNDPSFENCQSKPFEPSCNETSNKTKEMPSACNSEEKTSICITEENTSACITDEQTSICITEEKTSYSDSKRNSDTPQLNGELPFDTSTSPECVDIFQKDDYNRESSPEEDLPYTNKDLFPVKFRENESMNTKSNCFIDAATLLDDNEVTPFVPSVMSYSCHEIDQTKFMSLPFFPTVEEKSIDDNLTKTPGSKYSHSEIHDGENASNRNVNVDDDLKARRSSLIRRNTFELELDDERLEILRSEYERHKDKVDQNNINTNSHKLHNNGDSSNNPPSSDKHLENSKSSCDYIPNIPTDLKFSQKYEEDMHSPDSLNNDETIDSSRNQFVEHSSGSYPLRFDLNYSEYKGDYALDDISHKKQESKESDFFHEISDIKENSYNTLDKTCTDTFSIKSKQCMKTIESAPIVSGGVSLKDLSPPEKQISSPLAGRRKTELAPIISGGSIIEIDPGKEQKARLKTTFSESWTIDMTEASKSPIEDNQFHGGLLNIEGKADEEHSSPKSKNSSLGFFVPLDNPFEEKSLGDSGYKSSSCRVSKDGDKSKDETTAKYCSSDSNTSSASCGFYIDLSNAHECSLNSIENEENNIHPASDKKPFSMFVDIGKNSESDDIKSSSNSPHVLKKNKQTKTSPSAFSKFNEKHKCIDSQMSSESSLDLTESSEFSNRWKETKHPKSQLTSDITNIPLQVNDKKQSFYMFIEAENSPFMHRKTLPSGLIPASQRHSWNSESHNISPTMNSKDISKTSHVQTHNVFVNKSLDVMFNVNQEEKQHTNIPSKENGSNSIEVVTVPTSVDEQVFKSSRKNRHGSSKLNKDSQKEAFRSEVNNFKGTKYDTATFPMSENTFKRSDSSEKNADSSFISITSNDSSSSDIHNSTFIIYDAPNDENATINDLELSTPVCEMPSQLSNDDLNKLDEDCEEGQRKTSSDFPVTPDHSITQNIVPPKDADSFSFVKLSDMDKEPAKLHVEEKQVVSRMSRSTPGASWIETKMMTRSATSRSLTRLFPHLNTSAHNLSDGDNDLSEISSMQSSMDPSGLEGSTEDTEGSSCGGKPVSRLGEDLLRMFLDEISPDVTVEVGGRRIKAHKCILSSRCQYFAAILSGGWVESAGNVISLQGDTTLVASPTLKSVPSSSNNLLDPHNPNGEKFSYNTVHFALCHIYSGANNVPDSINIVELATLADMLCLEGLKEVIMYTLKVKFCHFFHKPCPMCTVGVLECLPLAAAYGLDEIYRKSLRWITKHFIRVWPTKGFASLPRELLDKCYKQHIIHMSVDNVLETALACTKLQDVIPAVRWAEPVTALAHRLCDSIVKYMAQHFSQVLSPDMLLPLGRQKLWSMSGVEEIMLTAAEKLPPDQACKSYSQLHKLLEYVDSCAAANNIDINEDFVKFLRKLWTTVEASVLRQASRASRTPAWTLMEPQLRHKIQDASCLVIVPGDDRRRARHLLKKGDSPNANRPMPANAKTTTSEAPQGKKVTQVKSSNISKQRTGNAASAETSGPRPKTWPCKLSEVKSRYLEQKPTPKHSPALSNTKPEKTTPVGRRNVSKSIISSSDSSRTSSPAMKRPLAQRPSRSLPNKDNYISRKKESLSVSNDSPTDPSTSGPKQKGEANTTLKKNQSLTHIDFIDRNMRFLSVKSGNAKRATRENLSSATISYSKEKVQSLKTESDKNKHLNLKSSSQNSPLTKDSPMSQTRSSFNSTPPSASKNTPSPKTKSATMSESKTPVLKRTSTYRVNTKSNSLNVTNPKSRETNVGSPTVRGNINKLQCKESTSKKCSTNNNIVSNNGSKTETKVQPMVGSRSGTFLKDEPTVLKKPTVMNVSE